MPVPESVPIDKLLFDKLFAQLRSFRIRALERGYDEAAVGADRADVLLRDFGAAAGEKIQQLEIALIISREALEKAQAALQGVEARQRECDAAFGEIAGAAAAVAAAIDNWPKHSTTAP